jgi:hypothetical protein
MSRKGKKTRQHEEEMLYRIHYERVRRNSEYKERFAALTEHSWGADYAHRVLAGEWGVRSGDEAPNPEERPPLGEALTRAIPEGWSARSTALLTDRRLDRAMSAVSAALTGTKLDREAIAGTLSLAYIPDEDEQRHRVTTLDMRWSKKELMETLESWVDQFLRDRAMAGLNQERPQQRLRVTEYSDYLRAYDLREEGRRTYREIAETLWPAAAGALEKRARDYYNKGKALILKPPLAPQGRRSSPESSRTASVKKPNRQ